MNNEEVEMFFDSLVDQLKELEERVKKLEDVQKTKNPYSNVTDFWFKEMKKDYQ